MRSLLLRGVFVLGVLGVGLCMADRVSANIVCAQFEIARYEGEGYCTYYSEVHDAHNNCNVLDYVTHDHGPCYDEGDLPQSCGTSGHCDILAMRGTGTCINVPVCTKRGRVYYQTVYVDPMVRGFNTGIQAHTGPAKPIRAKLVAGSTDVPTIKHQGAAGPTDPTGNVYIMDTLYVRFKSLKHGGDVFATLHLIKTKQGFKPKSTAYRSIYAGIGVQNDGSKGADMFIQSGSVKPDGTTGNYVVTVGNIHYRVVTTSNDR